jgi:hypothetical protein
VGQRWLDIAVEVKVEVTEDMIKEEDVDDEE